jgi:hypothetical protein
MDVNCLLVMIYFQNTSSGINQVRKMCRKDIKYSYIGEKIKNKSKRYLIRSKKKLIIRLVKSIQRQEQIFMIV